MDARAWIIGFTWLAVMVTAYAYLSIGKISWQTDIAVALLFLVGCTVTVIVGFGLEYFQTQMEKEKPSTKTLAQMSAEITEMRSMIQKLTEKVDVMQKELQE